MRIGLFGGTFDPPHHGHLLAASDAFEALALDRLVWIPAAQQPLKAATSAATPADRLAMVRLCVGEDPRFAVDAIEIERAGLSYTVETVEAYAARHPGDDLFVLLGADVSSLFHKWRAPRRIAELARLTILRRPAGDGSAADSAATLGAIRAVTGPDVPSPIELATRHVEISSTEVRERVQAGRSLHGFVPDAVARYIHERGLYR